MPRTTRDCPLSGQQLRIVSLLALGFSRPEVCDILHICDVTLRNHLQAARYRTGLPTTEALTGLVVAWWLRSERLSEQEKAERAYLDRFDRKLDAVRSRPGRRADPRNPFFGGLDDMMKLLLD